MVVKKSYRSDCTDNTVKINLTMRKVYPIKYYYFKFCNSKPHGFIRRNSYWYSKIREVQYSATESGLNLYSNKRSA